MERAEALSPDRHLEETKQLLAECRHKPANNPAGDEREDRDFGRDD